MTSDISLDVALEDTSALKGLSSRESELVRKAGERVFELSRRLAERERELDRLRSEHAHLRELLEETVRSRDVLSSQIMALHTDAERSYDERVQLRELLARAQIQWQEVVTSLVAERKSPVDPAPAASTQSAIPAAAPQQRRRPRARKRQLAFAPSAIRNWLDSW